MKTEVTLDDPRTLAGFVDGHPERFVPELMGGQLIAAEHFARYLWAARAVRGRRVLDAACGVGFGAALLAEAGAAEVVGVDIAADVLEAVRPVMPAGVRLVAGDVLDLPFDDREFDVVVSFETVEHVDDPAAALAELARVVRDDGCLVVSSPNRGVYDVDNPHHRHELTSVELEAALAELFPHVQLFAQHDWLASGVVPRSPRRRRSPDVRARRLDGAEGDAELYTLAAAARSGLPKLPPVATLTTAAQLREAQGEARERADELEAAQQEIGQARSALAERERKIAEVERHARDLERHAASLETRAGDLEQHAAELERLRAMLEDEVRRARSRADELTTRLDEAERLADRLDSEARARAFELRVNDDAFRKLNKHLVGVERALHETREAHSRAEEYVAAIHRTKTFRYMRPLRSLYSRLRSPG